MTKTLKTAPVRREVTVKTGRDRAFRLFTERMSDWVPPAHSLLEGRPRRIVLEPGEGGRWYETAPDGARHDWGHVRAWEPPGRLVLVWQLGRDFRFDPGIETEVEVRFEALDAGRTRVMLEHRGLDAYGAAAEEMRATFDKPNAWADWMAGYAALIG